MSYTRKGRVVKKEQIDTVTSKIQSQIESTEGLLETLEQRSQTIKALGQLAAQLDDSDWANRIAERIADATPDELQQVSGAINSINGSLDVLLCSASGVDNSDSSVQESAVDATRSPFDQSNDNQRDIEDEDAVIDKKAMAWIEHNLKDEIDITDPSAVQNYLLAHAENVAPKTRNNLRRIQLKLSVWNNRIIAEEVGITPFAIMMWWKKVSDSATHMNSGSLKQLPIHTPGKDAEISDNEVIHDNKPVPVETRSQQTEKEPRHIEVAKLWTKTLNLSDTDGSAIQSYLDLASTGEMTRSKKEAITRSRDMLLRNRGVQIQLMRFGPLERYSALAAIGAKIDKDEIISLDIDELAMLRDQFKKRNSGGSLDISRAKDVTLTSLSQLLKSYADYSPEKRQKQLNTIAESIRSLSTQMPLTETETENLFLNSHFYDNPKNSDSGLSTDAALKLRKLWSRQKPQILTEPTVRRIFSEFTEQFAEKPETIYSLQRKYPHLDIEETLVQIYDALSQERRG